MMWNNIRTIYRVLHAAGRGFLDDNVMTFSAALSFYTLLSFAPLMVIIVWLMASLEYASQEMILAQLESLAGENARQAASAVLESASIHPSISSLAGITGVLVSLIGATTVFAQLQSSLNHIWSIEARPGRAIWHWLKRRILSVGLIGAIVFISLVSLLISSALGALLIGSGPLWDLLNQLISLVVYAGLFALLFRYLADVHLPWTRALWGGGITALLFVVGKSVIGFYLARGDIGGAYGAAGSFVVLLVWVYYSSAIFFFGAEMVQAWFDIRGESMRPAEFAVNRDDT